MEQNQVVKQSLTTEKPDFFNPDINGDPTTAKGLVDWCKAYSMRKDKPSLNDLIEKEKQVNQSKPFCGFEFVPEPEEAAHPIPAKGSDDWYKMYPMVKDKPVEVSPETEQPKTPLEKVLGSALNEVKSMQQYNQKLEQENAELKADKEEVSKMAVNLERDNQGMAKRIAELEAQLAVKNEPLSNTEQLPVGTIVHIVIEFDNRKGYRMLHISEPNCTCKKAFEWAHNQASMVEGIITSYDYAFPPKKQ